jgi:hypothetical protein
MMMMGRWGQPEVVVGIFDGNGELVVVEYMMMGMCLEKQVLLDAWHHSLA